MARTKQCARKTLKQKRQERLRSTDAKTPAPKTKASPTSTTEAMAPEASVPTAKASSTSAAETETPTPAAEAVRAHSISAQTSHDEENQPSNVSNKPVRAARTDPTQPEEVLDSETIAAVADLVTLTIQQPLLTPPAGKEKNPGDEGQTESKPPGVQSETVAIEAQPGPSTTETTYDVPTTSLASLSQISLDNTGEQTCTACKEAKTSSKLLLCRYCSSRNCGACENLAEYEVDFIDEFSCTECESIKRIFETTWKETTPWELIDRRLNAQMANMAQRQQKLIDAATRIKQKGRRGLNPEMPKQKEKSTCNGCGDEDFPELHKKCILCQKSRCMECERLEPSDYPKIREFFCLTCETDPKTNPRGFATTWHDTEPEDQTPQERRQKSKAHYEVRRVIKYNGVQERTVREGGRRVTKKERTFYIQWADGTMGYEWESHFDDAVDMLNTFLRHHNPPLPMTTTKYLLGKVSGDAPEEELVPLDHAVEKVRKEQRRLNLNPIPVVDWPDLKHDQVFIYPYKLHAYAGLYIKELEIVLLGDGGNNLTKNAQLRREVCHGLLKPHMKLIMVNAPSTEWENYCASEAVTIAIALIRKYAQKDWTSRIIIQPEIRHRARTIQPVTTVPMGDKRVMLSRSRCRFCHKCFKVQKGVNRVIVQHEKRCPENPNER